MEILVTHFITVIKRHSENWKISASLRKRQVKDQKKEEIYFLLLDHHTRTKKKKMFRKIFKDL